jgi:hypothetical protein
MLTGSEGWVMEADGIGKLGIEGLGIGDWGLGIGDWGLENCEAECGLYPELEAVKVRSEKVGTFKKLRGRSEVSPYRVTSNLPLTYL